MTQYFGRVLLVLALGVILSREGYANNLSVTHVALGARDPNAKTVVVTFDVGWQNSWRNKINHDAAWLTIRLNNAQVTPTAKQLCQISASGLNPTGTSAGSGSPLEVYVPPDRTGAFLRRSSNGNVGNIAASNIQLTVNYQNCGFNDSDQIHASVFGLEMVFIPQGFFYAGDANGSVASLNKGSGDSNPWDITSENALAVSNPPSKGYRYISNNNPGEYASGSAFTIPDVFPKGYNAFYVMKYELTEGQWVEFVNSLPGGAARANRDLTDNNHKNSDSVVSRNTISCSGSPFGRLADQPLTIACSTQRPWRAVNFLSWMDLAAFLDWNAMRPMTELEFEKVARGPALPLAGEYVWGSKNITAAGIINGTEDGTEVIGTVNANAHYNNTTLSGADASGGAEYQRGPLRGGIFAGPDSTRVSAGASYYGVMDLGGNLKERVVTIGNSAGLAFTGTHGDGVLTTLAGYEGNANVANWPGMDASPDHGVSGAVGCGFRGGSWADSADRLRTSDRYEAALTSTAASDTSGGRGVRSYEGN